jgi:hypothetical protein
MIRSRDGFVVSRQQQLRTKLAGSIWTQFIPATGDAALQ